MDTPFLNLNTEKNRFVENNNWICWLRRRKTNFLNKKKILFLNDVVNRWAWQIQVSLAASRHIFHSNTLGTSRMYFGFCFVWLGKMKNLLSFEATLQIWSLIWKNDIRFLGEKIEETFLSGRQWKIDMGRTEREK